MKKLFTRKTVSISLMLICSICFSAEQKKPPIKRAPKRSQQQVVTCKCLNCYPHRCPPGSTAAEKELAIMRKMRDLQVTIRSQQTQKVKVQ